MMKFRIGTKLAISAGVGVVLVAGMLANQLIGSASVLEAETIASNQTEIYSDVLRNQIAFGTAQVARRNMLLAKTTEELQTQIGVLEAAKAEADKYLEDALARMAQPANRDRAVAMKETLATYVQSNIEQGAERAKLINLLDRQLKTNPIQDAAFTAIDKALAGPAAGNAELQASVSAAMIGLKDARIAFWRLTAMQDQAFADRVQTTTTAAAAALDRAARQTSDSGVTQAIADMKPMIAEMQAISRETLGALQAIDKIDAEVTRPARTRLDGLAAEAIAAATSARSDAETAADVASDRAATLGMIAGALVILVLIGNAIFAMMTIARPIRRIGDVLLVLAGGDKSVEVPYADRGDEVGDTARAARTFKDNLIRMEALEAEQKQAELLAVERRRADMIQLADDFQSAVGGVVSIVSSAATELQAAASTLTGTAEETAKQSITVSAAAEEASANVATVAAATEELSSSIDEIGRQVTSSTTITRQAVSEAERTAVIVQDLSQSAQRISEVIDLISTIAAQTNLLALNATIEAARAGEAGRGFAVVAAEVKGLADQTAKATTQISEQIGSIQDATGRAVQAINGISGTIENISRISGTIASAVEEQSTVTREITRSVQQASTGTVEVSANITGVSRSSEETTAAASQVNSAAEELARQSETLRSKVDDFVGRVRAG